MKIYREIIIIAGILSLILGLIWLFIIGMGGVYTLSKEEDIKKYDLETFVLEISEFEGIESIMEDEPLKFYFRTKLPHDIYQKQINSNIKNTAWEIYEQSENCGVYVRGVKIPPSDKVRAFDLVILKRLENKYILLYDYFHYRPDGDVYNCRIKELNE